MIIIKQPEVIFKETFDYFAERVIFIEKIRYLKKKIFQLRTLKDKKNDTYMISGCFVGSYCIGYIPVYIFKSFFERICHLKIHFNREH